MLQGGNTFPFKLIHFKFAPKTVSAYYKAGEPESSIKIYKYINKIHLEIRSFTSQNKIHSVQRNNLKQHQHLYSKQSKFITTKNILTGWQVLKTNSNLQIKKTSKNEKAVDLKQIVKCRVTAKLQVNKTNKKNTKRIFKNRVNMDIWHWVKFLITSLRHRPY